MPNRWNVTSDEPNYSYYRPRFYHIWYLMARRCNSQKSDNYKYYGGRGIICFWKSYIEFKKDMYDSYLKHVEEFGERNTTIDRKDNNLGYFKENCRWVTWKEQTQNKRPRKAKTPQ